MTPCAAPRVSVVMNCLNGERYLREAIDSVFAQTYQDWEIVFWDNASTDSSAAIARSYADKLRYLRAGSTTSLGQARTLAFAEARGEYIAMLDVDDLWEPEKLALQVSLLDSRPQLALAYCDTILFDQAGGERRFFETTAHPDGHCFAELLANNFICTGTPLFRACSLAGIRPLFEADLHMVMDYYLTLRLAYSHPLGVVDKPLVRHRIHPESESSRKWRLFSKELNTMLARLENTLPAAAHRFGPQLRRARLQADLHLALDAWTAGDLATARQALRPHRFRSLAPTIALAACRLYPWPLPAEKLRRIKHRLTGLWRKGAAPFRSHGPSTS